MIYAFECLFIYSLLIPNSIVRENSLSTQHLLTRMEEKLSLLTLKTSTRCTPKVVTSISMAVGSNITQVFKLTGCEQAWFILLKFVLF